MATEGKITLKDHIFNTNLEYVKEKFEELEVEIDRSSGRIFVKEGTNLMNYIKDGKVWVKK